MATVKKPGVDLEKFLGEPCLLKGERSELYYAISAQVQDLLKPKNILDQMVVRDLVDKIWEGLRYKRLQSQLIEVSCGDALAEILRLTFQDIYFEAAKQKAQDYYSGDPKKISEIKKLLTERGITDEMIRAKAVAMQARELVLSDRLIANRETSRNILYRDHERRLRKAEKAKKHDAGKPPAPDEPDSSIQVAK